MIVFLFLAYLAIFGSVLYALFSLSWPWLVLAVMGALFLSHFSGVSSDQYTTPRLKSLGNSLLTKFSFDRDALWMIGVVVSCIGFVHAVMSTAIVTAVRTPWAVLAPGSLVWLGVGFFCLMFCKRWRGVGVFMLVFAALSVAAFAYPLGFGFDPFIHRAAVSYIAQHGVITPKTPYYIGQYVIELVATKFLHLPLRMFDVLLVPALAAGVMGSPLRRGYEGQAGVGCGIFKKNMLFILPFIPLVAFTQTTPQALAFVFIILAILWNKKNQIPHPTPDPIWIFALAALACHPIAGIPAVIFAGLTMLDRAGTKRGTETEAVDGFKTRLYIGIGTALGCVAVPVAFIVLSMLGGQNVGFSWAHVADLSRLPLSVFFGTHFNAALDTAYVVIANLWLMLLGLAVYGVVLVKKQGLWREYRASVLTAVICFVNFVLLALLFDFPFLPAYERTDFALRLLTLAELFLLPTAGFALGHVWGKIDGKLGRVFWTGLLAVVFCANVYGAYPRDDQEARSAAFNVSAADIAMVQRIDAALPHADYVVLADQTLSAAAMEEYGFRKYYHGDIFYYPIPTGGPLYRIYLDMVEGGPTLEKVERARQLTGVDTIVFAVHRYWWNSANIIENAKALTSNFFCSQDDSVCVFIYTAR